MTPTPLLLAENLKKELNFDYPIYLKREDLHPYGSHKGRSIPVMIEYYLTTGIRSFVISSSGNAAIAAAHYVIDYNTQHSEKINLEIFIGQNISADKLLDLKKLIAGESEIKIEQVSNPKQVAFQKENKDIKNLRQSTDDTALVGYKSLANELSEIKNLYAVFIPTSSGTTAQGLHRAFQKIGLNPQIHIVQTTACHPFVTHTDENDTETSLAGAIVDKIAHRKNSIFELLKNSGGMGWVANNNQIRSAMDLIKQTENIDCSPNSALSIVGLTQAIQHGYNFQGPIACLITGK